MIDDGVIPPERAKADAERAAAGEPSEWAWWCVGCRHQWGSSKNVAWAHADWCPSCKGVPVPIVREMDRSTAPACLRCVLLFRPDAHPVWNTYQVGLVHLRPLADWPPAQLLFPDATHEIQILALDPAHTPNPDDPSTLHRLLPPNLIHQLRGRTDENALKLFDGFVRELSREVSPDTDHRSCQLAWLERWATAQ